MSDRGLPPTPAAGYHPPPNAAAAAAAAAAASASHWYSGGYASAATSHHHHQQQFGGGYADGFFADKSLYAFQQGHHPFNYARPLPAHSPLPAHVRSAHAAAAAAAVAAVSPLPAHARHYQHHYPPFGQQSSYHLDVSAGHYRAPVDNGGHGSDALHNGHDRPDYEGQKTSATFSSSHTYDAMAATILNSFGGSQLPPNLIHPDVIKNIQEEPQKKEPPERQQPVGLNLSSNPPSPDRDKVVRQPRGPTIDARSEKTPVQELPQSTPTSVSAQSQAQTATTVTTSNSYHKVTVATASSNHSLASNSGSAVASPVGTIAGAKRKSSSSSEHGISKIRKRIHDCQGDSPKPPLSSLCVGAQDPYSFDEGDDEGNVSNKTALDLANRFGQPRKTQSSVYKFKNALLSRENRTSSTESSTSSSAAAVTAKPLVLTKDEGAFLDTCGKFLDDLQTKVVSVSSRPNMDAYRERFAARKEKNCNRGRKKKVLGEAPESLNETPTEIEDAEEPLDATMTDGDYDDEQPLAKATLSPKKSPVRKKKQQKSAESVIVQETENNNCLSSNGAETKAPPGSTATATKKGGLWALPIVPKLPQKSSEKKRLSSPTPQVKSVSQQATNSKEVDLCDVWRQAFGARKTAGKNVRSESQAVVKSEPEEPKAKTYFDVPPEVRRRPRPKFGGLIHFAPDWEAKVQSHHAKCKIPSSLTKEMSIKPKILRNISSLNSSSTAYPVSPVRENDAEPQEKLYETPPPQEDPGEGTSASSVTVADTILGKRRMRQSMGRNYKVPLSNNASSALSLSPREKKRMRVAYDKLPTEEGMGLLPTPGLPMLTQDITEVLIGTNFGNFRRQTLLRYLDSMDDSAELKAKLLDWKPEVLESKTRRQSNSKVKANYKEIFGLNLPTSKSAASAPVDSGEVTPASSVPSSSPSTAPKTPKKMKKGKVEEPEITPKKSLEDKKSHKKGPSPTTPKKQDSKDRAASANGTVQANKSEASQTDDEDSEYVPTEKEEELQNYLQTFALDLLDDNLSWANKVVIQNLVIWEPVDPSLLPPPDHPPKARRKTKKHKKRQSGLDFSRKSEKKKANSRDISRASSVERNTEHTSTGSRVYSLDNVISECKGWVIDKGAGETILHRASKMGYPDVAAYALNTLGVSAAACKDNAGLPPIHKAAFRGHADVVRVLLRFGVDPNTNVKGTRPLHEALEAGNAAAVHLLLSYGADPLLYDYSGNMPIDLTEGDNDMREYLGGLLADLHGKECHRWSVSHDVNFHIPPPDLHEDEEGEQCNDDFTFEMTAQPLPPFFRFPDRPGHYVLLCDLKSKSVPESAEKVTLTTEDFLRSARCCSLGYTATPPSSSSSVLTLVRVDNNTPIRKTLGLESPSKRRS